jgi:hypothetical protein
MPQRKAPPQVPEHSSGLDHVGHHAFLPLGLLDRTVRAALAVRPETVVLVAIRMPAERFPQRQYQQAQVG